MNRTLKDPLSKVAIYGSVSVDGFIADENDLPRPKGWDPEAPFHFVHSAAGILAKARQPAGERSVKVSAGEAGRPALHLRFPVRC